MELRDVVGEISSFPKLSHADKIRFFAWFLHYHQGLETFTASDITKCYRDLYMEAPSSIHPFLTAMENRKPKEVIKHRGTYSLEQRVRDDLIKRYGKRSATVAVDKLLSNLPQLIPNLAEREYLDEALICFRHKAYRALDRYDLESGLRSPL